MHFRCAFPEGLSPRSCSQCRQRAFSARQTGWWPTGRPAPEWSARQLAMTAPTTLQASAAAKAWRAYSRDPDPHREQDLIERHLPLVRQTVDRLRINLPPTLDIDDLYSAGITGLISAVQRYD